MNEHIKSICNEHMLMEMNPEYGILINGPWGCGKTYIINSIIEDTPKGVDSKDIIKISMYGVTSIEDIEERIFEKINPVTNNKKIGKFINNETIESFSGFLNNRFSVDASIFFKLLSQEWFKTKKIIFVDDLERSKIDIQEILGYFYNLIIEKNTRVIFIGNDEMLGRGDYSKTKEKVIGKTLRVTPNTHLAIQEFLRECPLVGISNDKALEVIKEVLQELEFENLRAVRLGLININTLMAELMKCKSDILEQRTQEYNENSLDKYFENIFKIYMSIFLQYAGDYIIKIHKGYVEDNKSEGNIVVDPCKGYIHNAIKYYFIEGKGIKHYVDDMNAKDILTPLYSYNIPLTMHGTDFGIWEKYLFDSIINPTEILEAFKVDEKMFVHCDKTEVNTSIVTEVASGLWSMENGEFHELYDKMVEKFKSGNLTELGEILHGFSILLYMEEQEIKKYEKSIEDFFSEIIEKYSINMQNNSSRWEIYYRNGSMGISYCEINDRERWVNFYTKCIKIINEYNEKSKIEGFIEEIRSICNEEDENKWMNRIYDIFENTNTKYAGVPIISKLDIEEMFKILINKNYMCQHGFISALRKRYGKNYSNGIFEKEYNDDFDNLVLLEEFYKNYLEHINPHNIEKHRVRHIVELLSELVEYCRKYINKQD